jgi:hypothetical protein
VKVDVVVVSFNSRDRLRACVEPLTDLDWIDVYVADNASEDESLEVVADLPVTALPQPDNRGFSHGCNVGAAAGSSPFLLFLNPDASIGPDSIRLLVEDLETHERAGIVAPKIISDDGTLHHSLRRFPRLRSTYAQALFLHRLAPRALWADEVIRRDEWYERTGIQEWVSGACLLVRRDLYERLGGFDEGFFLYCEDVDLCLRARAAGFDVRYQPAAIARHEGGASAPRWSLLAIAMESKLHYARKHRSRPAAALERLGLTLGALVRVALGQGGKASRSGYARALRSLVGASVRG